MEGTRSSRKRAIRDGSTALTRGRRKSTSIRRVASVLEAVRLRDARWVADGSHDDSPDDRVSPLPRHVHRLQLPLS